MTDYTRNRPSSQGARIWQPSPADKLLPHVHRVQERLATLETPFTPIVSSFLALPGLVGFWPMSSVDVSSGDAYDVSGQARRITYTGNPTYNAYNNSVPYIDFDGAGDYLALTDAADLDIIGNEAHNASAVRGLTMGGWFWSDSIATQYALMGKFLAAGNQRSYWLQFASSQANFAVSTDGVSTAINVSNGTNLTTGAWYFVVGRFIPSTQIAVFVNNVKTSNTTSIPATIFSGTADFDIGAFSGGVLPLNGRASMCFLCANQLSDSLISNLFSATRGWFNV